MLVSIECPKRPGVIVAGAALDRDDRDVEEVFTTIDSRIVNANIV